MNKKFLALFLALGICLSALAGCSPNAPQQVSTPQPANSPGSQSGTTSNPVAGEQVLRVAESSANERPTYDPAITLGSKTIVALMHDTLMKQDENGNIIGSAAESLDVSADGLVYTFHLRKEMKWADGQKITAEHFLYTLTRACTAATASENNYLVLPYIKNAQKFFNGEVDAAAFGVKAPDENTLEITLESPTGYFVQILDYALFAPSRPDVVEANPEAWSITAETCLVNGPFKPVAIKQGEKMEFVKNENYWDAASVKLDRVIIYFFADENTAFSAYKTGEVDICNLIPSGEILTMFSQGNPELSVTPSLGMSYLSINNEKINSIDLRKAIAYAIDRETLLDSDVAKITKSPLFGMVVPGINLNGKDFSQEAGDYGFTLNANPEKAKEHLAAAGYPDGAGLAELVILSKNSESHLKSAQIYQAMLKDVGIKSVIRPIEDKVFWAAQLEGDYDLSVSGWGGDYVHPMTFLEFKTTANGQNVERYSNLAFDEAIKNAQLSVDPAKQLEYLLAAEKYLIDDAGMVPISFRNSVFAIKPYVKGIWRAPSEYQSIAQAYIENK